MADYVYLKLSDGQLLKVLTDSNGVIQTSPNGDPTSFTGIAAGSATVSTAASLSGDGSSGSPLTVVSAPLAATATAPASAAAFTAALNAATTSLQGMMSAADKALMPSDVRTVLGAPASTITVSGLDGDNDGDYQIYLYIPTAATTGAVTLKYNGVATAQFSSWVEETGASTVQGSRNTGAWELCGDTGSGDRIGGWMTLRSTSADTFLFGQYQMWSGNGATFRNGIALTTAAIANITSLSVTCGGTNAFATGSYMAVRKLHRKYP